MPTHHRGLSRRSGVPFPYGWIGYLGLLAATACTSPGPSFVPHPESGIELRWPNGNGTVDMAQAMADKRCALKSLHAIFTSESMDQDETLARFVCG